MGMLSLSVAVSVWDFGRVWRFNRGLEKRKRRMGHNGGGGGGDARERRFQQWLGRFVKMRPKREVVDDDVMERCWDVVFFQHQQHQNHQHQEGDVCRGSRCLMGGGSEGTLFAEEGEGREDETSGGGSGRSSNGGFGELKDWKGRYMKRRNAVMKGGRGRHSRGRKLKTNKDNRATRIESANERKGNDDLERGEVQEKEEEYMDDRSFYSSSSDSDEDESDDDWDSLQNSPLFQSPRSSWSSFSFVWRRPTRKPVDWFLRESHVSTCSAGSRSRIPTTNTARSGESKESTSSFATSTVRSCNDAVGWHHYYRHDRRFSAPIPINLIPVPIPILSSLLPEVSGSGTGRSSSYGLKQQQQQVQPTTAR
jgi:hypothetical protein